MEFLRRCWASIDLDAVADNVKNLQGLLSPGCRMMGVVKADAYGHGDKYIARCLREQGVDWFGVSNLEEAMSLRREGFEEPILIFGPTPVEYARELALFHITQTVHSTEYAQKLAWAAQKQGITVEVHVKIDTGMGRIGFVAQEDNLEQVAKQVEQVCRFTSLEPKGIFTHFSVADEEAPESVDYTRRQFERFMRVCTLLKERGVTFEMRHCCNSAAMLCYPEMHLDMVRVGVALYGLYPSGDCMARPRVPLRPAMELKSVVSMVKTLDQPRDISYGRSYTALQGKKIATVCIGYADGYHRVLSNRARMLVRGSFAPVVGRVCMDQLMLDVTGIDGVAADDVVTVFGRDGDCVLPVEELASLCGTVNYEIICILGRRVPRVYVSGGREIAVVNYIKPDLLG